MYVDETVLHLVVKNTLSLWIVNFPPKYFEAKIKVFEQIVQWLEKGLILDLCVSVYFSLDLDLHCSQRKRNDNNATRRLAAQALVIILKFHADADASTISVTRTRSMKSVRYMNSFWFSIC